MQTLRRTDSAAEQAVARFLDRKLYAAIGAAHTRHTDIVTQLKGVDVSLTYKDLVAVAIDEKANTHYVNKGLPTFAFELSFLHQGRAVEGWLTDSSKITDFYLLCWIWADKDRDFIDSDIQKVEAYLVSRKAILDYLAKHGYDKDSLRAKDAMMRSDGIDGPIDKAPAAGFYFFLTKRLSEQPINVIIRKNELARLAHSRFEILR